MNIKLSKWTLPNKAAAGAPSMHREFSYDFVRFVAMVFVVGVHARSVLVGLSGIESIALSALNTIVFTCNPLFFMLSGFFNVRKRTTRNDLLEWYGKKAKGLLIPIIVYFFLRTLHDSWNLVDNPVVLFGTFAHNLLSGFISSEYWFVYSLLALLAAAPFLARMIDSMSDFECRALVALCLIFNLIQTVILNIEVSFSWTFMFKDYAVYFLLGAILPRLVITQEQRTLLKLLGIIGVLSTTLVTALGFSARAFDTSPLFTLVSVGMYYVLLDTGARIGSCPAISFAARHSFGVYFVHMVLLQKVIPYIGSTFGLDTGFVAYGLAVLLCVALSLIVAFMFDSVLVRPIQIAFDAVLSLCKRRSESL